MSLVVIGEKLIWGGMKVTVCEVPPDLQPKLIAVKDELGRIYVNTENLVQIGFCEGVIVRAASSLEGKNTG